MGDVHKKWNGFRGEPRNHRNSNPDTGQTRPFWTVVKRVRRNRALSHHAGRPGRTKVAQRILQWFHCEQFLPATVHSTATHHKRPRRKQPG